MSFDASKSAEGCVGPSSKQAGTAPACAGCPNASACKAGLVDETPALVRDRLQDVKNVILVLSGKGGVGKSTVACQLSFALAAAGHSVGLLDIDICGPSVPRMLGLVGREVHRSASGWSPVYLDDIAVMSVGFMVQDDKAVIWRGPRKNGLIKQFLTEVEWGELDYLVVDTPPGTSDEHISLANFLKETNPRALVVTTPQEISMQDVRKELNFCVKTAIPVVGLLENMANLRVPLSNLQFYDQGNQIDLLQKYPELAKLTVTIAAFQAAENNTPQKMAQAYGVPYLGALPLDPQLTRACELGLYFADATPDSPAAAPFNTFVSKLRDSSSLENSLP